LLELGLEDAFAPDRITLVEWPERAPGLLPAHARTLTITGSGDGPRTVAS
jgi:tRNA A37 threonylcarbamoyladenosine biosynthesis protein TsaE